MEFRTGAGDREKHFHMVPEWDRQQATVMIWPDRPGTWGTDTNAAAAAFLPVWRAITEDEDLVLIVQPGNEDRAAAYLTSHGFPAEQVVTGLPAEYMSGNPDEMCGSSPVQDGGRITGTSSGVSGGVISGLKKGKVYLPGIPTDDSWARDTSPFFRTDGQTSDAACFGFNAWGGSFDGLYQDYQHDAAFGMQLAAALHIDAEDDRDFILEGGSVHTDGEGTLLVTEECLLSPGRNPDLSRTEIEARLCDALGAEKVLWLPYGVWQDETDGHVDNICCFSAPGEVLLAWTDDTADPQYERSLADLHYLQGAQDARGRFLKVRKVPLPHPLYVTEAECDALVAAPGEDDRTPGERLAGSYVNFLRTNRSVLVPQFGSTEGSGNTDNTEQDRAALLLFGEIFPGMRIVPIPARRFLLGGGNLHCLSHELPLSKFLE